MKRVPLAGLLLVAVQGWGAVLINEVAFDEPTGSPDWVELHNAGQGPVLANGWVLHDGDAASGNEIHIALSTPLPAGSFLRVFVDAAGADETDFSDGSGTIFSGISTTVNLAATEDEVGLYSGPSLSSSTLVDFLAWVTDDDYNGAGDQAHAVAAGLWNAGEAFSLADPGKGYSLGRIRDGRDTNQSADFQIFSRPTPGTFNVPPPSPYVNALQVDPGLKAFSPFDADPAFQSTRVFYQVGSAEVVKSIKIYDVRGRPVRVLLDNDRGPLGEDHSDLASGSVSWDGRDDAGAVAPVGVYALVLEGADPVNGHGVGGRDLVAIGRPK